MISTVTLNPCVDRHIEVSGFKIDTTNRAKNIRIDAGGKGVDVSRAIRIAGGDAMAFGFVGGEEGRYIESRLTQECVAFSFTHITGSTRICIIISDNLTGEQTRINGIGPQIQPQELTVFRNQLFKIIHKPEILVVSGSVPPGVPVDIYHQLINDASRRGVPTILDSHGEWLKVGIRGKPYLVKPNEKEAEELLGYKLKSEADIIRGTRQIVELGAEIAVISRAEKGIIACSSEEIIKAFPPPVKVVSTVGAGDSMVAGFAMMLSQGSNLVEACRLAVAMGTASVLTPGTELCCADDIKILKPKVSIERIV
jgi:6-phosphofructokinase 2